MSDATIPNRSPEIPLTTSGSGNISGQQSPSEKAFVESVILPSSEQGSVTTSREAQTVPSDTVPDSLLVAVLPSPSLGVNNSGSQLSLETLVIQSLGAGARTQQSHLSTLLGRQSVQAQELKAIRDERIGEMFESIEKAGKADKAGGLQKVLGILSIVASVAITFGSIGTASPAGAALMVTGTALTTAVSIDGMTGGNLMQALSGGNEWVALGLSLGVSLLGAGITMKGAAMISKALKTKEFAQGIGAGTAKGVAAQGGNVARSSNAAQTTAKTSAQATAQSKNAFHGSAIDRMVHKFSSSELTQYQLLSRTQTIQNWGVGMETAMGIAETVSGVPVAIYSYEAGLASARTKELKADATFVESRISTLQDYIDGASKALANNLRGMSDTVAGMRDANAAAASF